MLGSCPTIWTPQKLVDRKPGDVSWGEPVTHSVENLGRNEIHNLIVELKDGCGR
jgi:hypothetical protein